MSITYSINEIKEILAISQRLSELGIKDPFEKIDQIKKKQEDDFYTAYHSDRHYFSPSLDNSRFCSRCGEYFTDKIHIRK